MIRPSSLQIARHCDLAPVLSERFPATSDAMSRGSLVDAQVTAWVKDGTAPTDVDSRACVEWLASEFDPTEWELRAQEKVALVVDGQLVTEGTPDIVASCLARTIIVDLKKREQWDSGRLTEPDDNLQLHAYALAHGGPYQTCLLLFGNGKVEPIWSEPYDGDRAPILAEVIAAARRKDNPRGTSGTHCGQCYPRIHCPHWAQLAVDGATVRKLPEDATELILMAKAMEERSKQYRQLARDLVDYHGPFRVGSQEYRRVMMPGRVSPDVEAMEKAGIFERFSKVGGAYPSYRLTRPKEEK